VSGATVLVACGNAERRETFVNALAEAGWREVLTAAGLAEAASLARDDPNLCVIVDAELADVPGLKAVAILGKVCPRAKIIFTSPQNTRDLEAQVRALDVFYYHISSSGCAELAAAVKDAIGSPTPGRARPTPKVLVVDDDDAFHGFLRVVLESAGYAVVSAYSGQQGLEMARRERPDVILLDIVMESMTEGFEFCHEARRDPQLKHTPILGISEIEAKMRLPCPPDRERDLFPVDGYLPKPIETERLLTALRRLVPVEG
jgi:CheY-like chemotaxis protein